MYVEPVYAVASPAASDSSFPILRYVLVASATTSASAPRSRRRSSRPASARGVIDEPDRRAQDDPTDEPHRRRRHRGPAGADVAELLAQAQEEFDAADRALEAGDLAEYQEHIKRLAELVRRALAQIGGGRGPGRSVRVAVPVAPGRLRHPIWTPAPRVR